MIRIAISTLGCKTNQAESAAILAQFPADKATIVPWDSPADLYIINTCTVTNRTDYKSRNLIRHALKQKEFNPAAKIVVTGCFAQRSPKEIADLGAVDFVVDNQQKLDIAAIIGGAEYSFMDIMQAESFDYKPYSAMHQHTRAFQKIQDGCDFYCAYCAVPYARGHSRSATLEQVVQQATQLVDNGYREIVLGGVNLGLYRDKHNDLGEVVSRLAKLKYLELIRLSSLEPQLFSSKLISRLRGIPKLCPHFHIALQSGSDSILQAMGRHYTTSLVRSLVDELNTAFPFVAIGFDVITGFPGETDAQHRETLDFLSSLPITYLHVFSYSKRKGTPAEKMPNQVPKDIKNLRSNQLTELSLAKQADYRNLLMDNRVSVRGIVEVHKNGHSEFVSDHFLRFSIKGLHPLGEMLSQQLS